MKYRGTIFRRKGPKSLLCGPALAPVPQNRLLQTAGAAIVEISLPSTDAGGETGAPERCGPPFSAAGVTFTHVIRKSGSHVVEEQVGPGVNGLAAQFGERVAGAGS